MKFMDDDDAERIVKAYCVMCFVSYKRILIVISHSQDFLNGICTNIIHMHQRKLYYYGVSRTHSFHLISPGL